MDTERLIRWLDDIEGIFMRRAVKLSWLIVLALMAAGFVAGDRYQADWIAVQAIRVGFGLFVSYYFYTVVAWPLLAINRARRALSNRFDAEATNILIARYEVASPVTRGELARALRDRWVEKRDEVARAHLLGNLADAHLGKRAHPPKRWTLAGRLDRGAVVAGKITLITVATSAILMLAGELFNLDASIGWPFEYLRLALVVSVYALLLIPTALILVMAAQEVTPADSKASSKELIHRWVNGDDSAWPALRSKVLRSKEQDSALLEVSRWFRGPNEQIKFTPETFRPLFRAEDRLPRSVWFEGR